jgi:hypothetical protein
MNAQRAFKRAEDARVVIEHEYKLAVGHYVSAISWPAIAALFTGCPVRASQRQQLSKRDEPN